eukprot:COSAG01_NODE_49613_length_370_cov_5.944649_1_plen_39_part_01
MTVHMGGEKQRLCLDRLIGLESKVRELTASDSTIRCSSA